VTITLTTGISHATDTTVKLGRSGIDFDTPRVMFRVTLNQTGETRDYFVGNQPGDIDTIGGLIAAFPAFASLRNNLETYLAAKVAALAGNVS